MRPAGFAGGLVVASLALTVTAGARADCAKSNDVAIHPLAFASRGLAGEYERYALPPRFSLAAGLSARSAALGDFGSTTFGTMLEARWWVIATAPFACKHERVMAGPFVGVRFEAEETTVGVRATGRTIGMDYTLYDVALVGYRQSFLDAVELTLWGGLGAVHSLDGTGRLAPSTDARLLVGLSYGWYF